MSPMIKVDFRFVEIGYELDCLYDYWTGFNEGLETLKERKTQKTLRELKINGQLDEYESQFAHQQISDLYRNAVPRMLNYTFLTMLYSISEFTICEIARKIKTKKNIELEMNDFRGSFFDQAKIYFKKVLHFPLSIDCKEWQSLQKLRILRNAIVHNHGYWNQIPERDRRKIDDWITGGDDIGYISQLKFDGIFCEEIYCDVKKWLDSLKTEAKIELDKIP